MFLLQGFFSDLEKLKLPNNKLLWTIGTIELRSVHIYTTLTQRKSGCKSSIKKILDCCCASFSSYCKSFLNYILVNVIFILKSIFNFYEKEMFLLYLQTFSPSRWMGRVLLQSILKIIFLFTICIMSSFRGRSMRR